MLEINRELKLQRRIIYEHLRSLEAEGRVYRESSGKWHFGHRPEKPTIESESPRDRHARGQLQQHGASDLKLLAKAIEDGKFCLFFRRTFHPDPVVVDRDEDGTYNVEIPEHKDLVVDEAGRKVGCMYVIADDQWDRAKGNPVSALRDMFLVRTPYFLDKVIAAAVRAKVLSTERFTEKGELRKISDRDLDRLREWAFGGIGKFIVLFSIYPEVLFDWLRLTPEGKKALLEASKSPEVKAEVEKVRSYGKAGKKLSEKLKREDERRRRRRSDGE